MTESNLKFFKKISIRKEKSMDILIYPVIAFTIIIFNLIAIFGVDILLHDDPAHYFRVLHGKFPWYMLKHHLISPFTEFFGWNIMAYSPNLARGLYVLFLMVPLSFCIYYLLRHRLGFSKMTAYTSGVLPFILPSLWEIPAGINMSYVLWGLLASILSLILGVNYLEKDTPKNGIRLAFTILFYLIATQITEQALFLFPPFVFAFFGYKKFDKKNIILISGLTIIAVIRFVQTIAIPRNPSIPHALSFGEIIKRISLYFQWSLPSPGGDPVIIIIIFIGIILAGFVLYIKQPGVEPKNNRIFLYILLICWAISTIFVFIFISRDYSPRYVFISSFGLNSIFAFSIYVILKNLFPGKFKWYIPVFAAIIIFSGVSRYFTLKEMYTPWNNSFSIVQRDLNKMPLPLNSQIVVVGVSGISGCWEKSRGYLCFALKRKDISGLVGAVKNGGYYNFDNHFDHTKRGWGGRYRMTGLSMDKPVFLFRVAKKKGQLNQLEFALQWKGEKKDASWTILQVDKNTGQIFPFVSGVGMDEYESAILELQKKGIRQSDILWGGAPTKEEQDRLEGEIENNKYK
jgi:hypothetical protein